MTEKDCVSGEQLEKRKPVIPQPIPNFNAISSPIIKMNLIPQDVTPRTNKHYWRMVPIDNLAHFVLRENSHSYIFGRSICGFRPKRVRTID